MVTPCRARSAIAAAAAVLVTLVGCTTPESVPRGEAPRAAPAARLLTPLHLVTSARLAPAVDRTGIPAIRSQVAPLTSLVHPFAVAAMGNDLYIADSGPRRLYRLDLALDAMAVVPVAPVTPATRIAVGYDFSLYVLDAPHRRVLRFGRDGRLLATYSDAANLARPAAVAVDEIHGEIFVADQVFNLIVVFHALGGARQLIPMRGDGGNRVMSIGAIALGGGAIHISDPLCRCVQIVDRSGQAIVSYGHGQLGQPGAIAVDRHSRVFVVDQFWNSVKIYAGGRLLHEAPAAALGLVHITDLAVTEDRLMIADGGGARVAVLRVAPPGKE